MESAGDGAVFHPTTCERGLLVGAFCGNSEDLPVVFKKANARAIDDDFFAADLGKFIEAGDGVEFRHWACRRIQRIARE